MSTTIVVPSHRRSQIITTKIENMVLFVHESEADDYAHLECDIATHEEIGLASIRDQAFKLFGNTFFVDDDIVSVERLYTPTQTKLTPQEIHDLIQETYYVARSVDAHLYGFANSMNPKHYKPQKPFVANGYINACAFGMIHPTKLRFDSRTTACESHWINLLNAYHHRYALQDTRYAFRQKPNSTFLLEGGQTLKRTMESERRDTLILKATFGDSVQIKRGQKDSKLHHQYQRKLKIPL